MIKALSWTLRPTVSACSVKFDVVYHHLATGDGLSQLSGQHLNSAYMSAWLVQTSPVHQNAVLFAHCLLLKIVAGLLC